MFELSIAKRYLIPRKGQLSLSLIAVMSVAVISLVVWLVLVFLSVTEGMERGWLSKLTAMHAPVKITPTPAYFSSYYYQVDALSSASGYTHKTIGEKAEAELSDPYQPELDRELPSDFPVPEQLSGATLNNPVKKAVAILEDYKKEFPDLVYQDFELSGALMRLELARRDPSSLGGTRIKSSFLSQACYLASFSKNSPYLHSLLLQPKAEDFSPLVPFNEEEVQELKIDQNGKAEVMLPKSLRDNGVRIGDGGFLSYTNATMSAMQEQRLPISVVGFYDPGILSIGAKCILVPHSVTRAINASSNSYAFDPTAANGILVWFKDLNQAKEIKARLNEAFAQANISPYWTISSFHDYDFAKDLLQQFQSDKYLFTLIGIIILGVACCNIISLLILLVNDKKKEIGILLAMGARTKSIAAIFAFCGMILGLLSSFIGTAAAFLTLRYMDQVVRFLSFLQGHEAFNVAFYGNSLPSELSLSALTFILIATPLLSLCAGLIPAWKACRLQPSMILRSEV